MLLAPAVGLAIDGAGQNQAAGDVLPLAGGAVIVIATALLLEIGKRREAAGATCPDKEKRRSDGLAPCSGS